MMGTLKDISGLSPLEDLEKFTTQVKKAFEEDIVQLKEDTTHLGTRVETLEQRLDEAIPTLSGLQMSCAAQDQRIETLLSQLDD